MLEHVLVAKPLRTLAGHALSAITRTEDGNAIKKLSAVVVINKVLGDDKVLKCSCARRQRPPIIEVKTDHGKGSRGIFLCQAFPVFVVALSDEDLRQSSN